MQLFERLFEKGALSILHKLAPEDANNITLKSLEARALLPGTRKHPISGQAKKLMGLEFANPCGIAAGLDKNGDCIKGLISLGPGFIELGSVTPLTQPGNNGKRIIRFPEEQALIKRLGFNNKGVDYLRNKLGGFRNSYSAVKPPHTIIGVNIGKGVNTPLEDAAEDYLYSMRLVHQVADYITINISSPNTPDLRQLQNKNELSALIDKIKNEETKLQQSNNKRCPLVVKISPDNSDEQVRAMAKIIMDFEIDGIIATNTSIEHKWRDKMAGGISGRPLADAALKTLKILNSECKGKVTLIATGGIDSPQEMQKRFAAGADLIQLYTALIYKGSGLINNLVV